MFKRGTIWILKLSDRMIVKEIFYIIIYGKTIVWDLNVDECINLISFFHTV